MRTVATKLTRISVALLAALLLSSCVGDVYPSHWPAPRAGAACADIVGTYANEGERDPNSRALDPRYNTLPLSRYIFEGTDRNPDGDAVEITRSGTLYRVRLLRGAQTVHEANFDEAKLACRDGWLTLQSVSGLDSKGQTAGYESRASMLHIASDGSLLLRAPGSFTGVAIVIPVHTSGVTYARFERRSNSAQPSR